MPPSVRFLDRRVYLGVVVVLVSAMQHGASPSRVSRLRMELGISRITLRRWIAWWRESFGRGGFFKGLSGLFAEPVQREALPLSLLLAFGGLSFTEAWFRVLRLLLPITSGSSPMSLAL